MTVVVFRLGLRVPYSCGMVKQQYNSMHLANRVEMKDNALTSNRLTSLDRCATTLIILPWTADINASQGLYGFGKTTNLGVSNALVVQMSIFLRV